MEIKLTNILFLLRRKLLLNIMKTFILLFCATVFSFTPNNVLSQNAKIKIEKNQTVTVDEVFDIIMEQTDYTFIYKVDLFKDFPDVTLNKGNIKANDLLDKSLLFAGLNFKLINKSTIVIEEKPISVKTQQIITGNVSDSYKTPLPGVTVLLKKTNIGVATDFDGNFEIKANIGDVLKFSYVGYETKEVVIDKTKLKVRLIEDVSSLDEVVVIGYGTTKIKEATGAINYISAKELSSAPVQNTVQSVIQGRAAGVNVMVQSSAPDSPISVIIRGSSSLSGDSQPLWVIDGVPEYGAGTSGDISNTLYNLNLDDVESINILKDAASAAIYGSRAANGVVLVTTKRGKKGSKPQIDLSITTSIIAPNSGKYRLFNSEEYKDHIISKTADEILNSSSWSTNAKMIFDYDAFLALNTSTQYNRDMLTVLPDAFGDGDTNWWDEIVQQSTSQRYNLAVSGGSEATRYRASLTYGKNDGVVVNSYSKNYGLTLNLDTDVSDKFTYRLNMSATSRESQGKNGVLEKITSFRPDLPAYNEDGTFYNPDSYFKENPLVSINNTNKGVSNNMRINNSFIYKPLSNLTLKTSANISLSNSTYNTFNHSGTSYASNRGAYRSLSKGNGNTMVWENMVTYFEEINDHKIDFTGVYSMEQSKSDRLTGSAYDYFDEEKLISLNYGTNFNRPTESFSETHIVSALGRIRYDFKKRYLATFTLRADGSSRFGDGNSWGYFPSGGIAWLISEEPFMKSLQKTIPYLKLRTSLGKSGSQNVSAYGWRKLLQATNSFEEGALVPGSNIGNSNLQWEETKQLDIGLDFALLNNKLSGTLGYYERTIDNMIFTKRLAPSSGYATTPYNVASITNNGLEFDLTYNIIRKDDISLKVSANIARNWGKLNKLDGVLESLNFPTGWGATSQAITATPGESLGNWYGFQTAGRWFATAEEIIALRERATTGYSNNKYLHTGDVPGGLYPIDQNGDGKIDIEDRVKLNSTFNPVAFGGFSMQFRYKAFSLNSQFTYSYGNKKYWYAMQSLINSNHWDNKFAIIENGYSYTGDPYSQFPSNPVNSNYQFNENFIFDASYIKLNNLSVNYNVPKDFLKKGMISKLVFSLQATNVFTITKYPGMDPQGNWDSEWNGSFFGMGIDRGIYPPARAYNFNMKLTFK
ncbi:SusC/RagA family TonB-linked outer membrane protein [Polaribacter butkevichii]|uniref:SusC/RagA family TonB-linked outer membrane protein n=1 Tax=Polaribacter butkevichii TaxID=218490 RepID=UPI000CF47753|nr:SusC/RagA family TonB-linked outer membrane protein [Polaribacter butkevichii]